MIVWRLLGFALLTLGCDDSTQRPPPETPHSTETARGASQTTALSPFEHEQEEEYQNGLSKFLTISAGLFTPKETTLDFRLGYVMGLSEANEMHRWVQGSYRQMGCMIGYIAVKDYLKPVTEEQAEELQEEWHRPRARRLFHCIQSLQGFG